MGQAMFYHLTRSGAFDTVMSILPRALAQGWPVMLRGTDRAALERLDERLWTDDPGSFLPHGMEGGPQDAAQPVLLGLGPAANGARGVFLLDGAAPLPGEEALERLWVIFDGNDMPALNGARALWTQLAGLGMVLQYWSEESGRWQMKTEKRPA